MNTPSSNQRVLRIGLPASIASMDPRESRDSISLLVVSAIYEAPFLPPEGNDPAEPRLFTGPLTTEVDGPDQWIYAGTLRSDLTFSDGTAVTPELAVASLSRGPIGQHPVRVSHRGQILFELDRPNPRFDLVLTLSESSLALVKGGELLGTGPFIAVEQTEDTIRLERNPNYRKPVPIDEVVYTVFPPDEDGGNSRLVEAVRSGEIDLATCLSRNEVTPLTGVCKKFLPSTSTAVLYLNTECPKLSDSRTRRAILQAIDRRAVTGVLHSNVLAFTAQSLLPPNMGLARDEIRHDPGQARRLLSEVGDAAPKTLDLLMVWARRPYLTDPRAVAELLARQIEAIGIEVDLVPGTDPAGHPLPMGAAEFFDRLVNGRYELALVGWICDTPDPADFFDTNLSSDAILDPGKTGVSSLNLGRIRSPEIDEALARYRRDPSYDTEIAVHRLVAEHAPLLPLMYGPSVAVHSWRVKGVTISSNGLLRFDLLELG